MITGAIFDMDGVLLDSMQIWGQVGELYIKSCERVPEPNLTEILFTKSMMDAAEYIRDAYSIEKTAEEIRAGIIDIMLFHYKTDIPAKKGALSFLRQLKEAGISVAVATASDRILAEAGLGRLGFLEYIDTIVTCREVGVGKEQPDVFLKALAHLGTDLATTWVFEDSFHAICTAKEAGFPVVGIYDAESQANQKKIKEGVTVYLKELTDFKGFIAAV